MKIYIASRDQTTLEVWSRILRVSAEVEFVNNAERPVQVDAIVVSGLWAFERYGGKPSREVAQVRPNTLGDGLPDWIVIPPFLPLVEQNGEFEVRADFKDVSPAYFTIIEALKAIRRDFGDSCSVIIDLPLLGMDNPRDESTPKSVAKAIEVFSEE